MIDTAKFGKGAIYAPHTPSDFHVREVAFASPAFDWNVGYDVEQSLGIKIKNKDQGQSGSCGGQAWSYMGGVLHAVYGSNVYEEKSAKFIYAQTFLPGGGSAGITNSKLVQAQGWGNEADTTSYLNGQPPTEEFMEQVGDITAAARAGALKDICFSYATMDLNIDDIAQAVRDNHGVVIGITGTNNGTWDSPIPVPPTSADTGDALWYHWLYVGRAKMINGVKYLGIQNSWGTSVGEDGWQWISEAYVRSYVWNVWTFVYKQQSIIIPHTFTQQLIYGMNNAEVKFLQARLQQLGYFPSTVNTTGYFGPITAKALVAWQVANGIMDFANETDLTQIRFGQKSIDLMNKTLNS